MDTEQMRAARFVADYWRKAALADGDILVPWRLAAHPLCMVLAALDGEQRPENMGIDPQSWDEFRAALGDQAAPTEPTCATCNDSRLVPRTPFTSSGARWAPCPSCQPQEPCGICGAMVFDGVCWRAAEHPTAPQAAPEPERCPTCGSADRMKVKRGCEYWKDDTLADPWHSAPPVEGEQP